MTISLDDLSPSQLRLLVRLGAIFPRKDAIGCEIDELSDRELITAHHFIILGLVEMVDGWRGTTWFMPTETAFRLIEAGMAE